MGLKFSFTAKTGAPKIAPRHYLYSGIEEPYRNLCNAPSSSIGPPKTMVTLEKVTEKLDMLVMDFSHLDKYRVYRNNKDGIKVATMSV